MYCFVWADQREKQGYNCDVSLKRRIQIICILENDASLYIDTTKPLLIVGLNLWGRVSGPWGPWGGASGPWGPGGMLHS